MVKILVGSENPVKLQAVRQAFSNYFNISEIMPVKVSSGVPDQPVNEQTFQGAENRAKALFEKNTREELNADFFVGIEGGIVQHHARWFELGAVCIIDKTGKKGFGTSPHFELPEDIVKELLSGVELGDVMDRITGKNNTKQNAGSIGFFTKRVMCRKDFYNHGIVNALIPFVNQDLFFPKE